MLDYDNDGITSGKFYTANYDSFRVGSEDTNYQLYLSGYDKESSTLADALSAGQHDGAKFTTYDRDNDDSTGQNCASQFSGGIN